MTQAKANAGPSFEHTTPTPESETFHPDDVDTTPSGMAATLLRRWGDRILVVRHSQGSRVGEGRSGWGSGRKARMGEPCAYLLNQRTGIWDPSNAPWRRILRVLSEDIEAVGLNLYGSGNDDAATALLKAAKRMRAKTSMLVTEVRLAMDAEVHLLRKHGNPTVATVCHADEIDADLRYLGTASGVVDLQTGQLLAPEDGRKKLISASTGTSFDPHAKHPAIAALFAHLEPQVREWWWDAMGHAMHGRPSRCLYMAVGARNGGKTTLTTAIRGALGSIYCTTPSEGALTTRGGTAGHQEAQKAFAPPARIAICDDTQSDSPKYVATERLKNWTGDSAFSFSRKGAPEETVQASPTLFWFCNPQSVPKMNLRDDAMADRLRKLPYPQVPKADRDPAMKGTVKDLAFRRAFLAALIQRAAGIRPGEPPEVPSIVRTATQEHIRDAQGMIADFALRIVQADGERMAFADVWLAWCELNGDATDLTGKTPTESGSIKQRYFSQTLTSVVPDLPLPRATRIEHKIVKGWIGWRLRSGEPA